MAHSKLPPELLTVAIEAQMPFIPCADGFEANPAIGDPVGLGGIAN
jgi:hypothetical protein